MKKKAKNTPIYDKTKYVSIISLSLTLTYFNLTNEIRLALQDLQIILFVHMLKGESMGGGVVIEYSQTS